MVLTGLYWVIQHVDICVYCPERYEKINDKVKIARQEEGAAIINMAFANAPVAIAA